MRESHTRIRAVFLTRSGPAWIGAALDRPHVIPRIVIIRVQAEAVGEAIVGGIATGADTGAGVARFEVQRIRWEPGGTVHPVAGAHHLVGDEEESGTGKELRWWCHFRCRLVVFARRSHGRARGRARKRCPNECGARFCTFMKRSVSPTGSSAVAERWLQARLKRRGTQLRKHARVRRTIGHSYQNPTPKTGCRARRLPHDVHVHRGRLGTLPSLDASAGPETLGHGDGDIPK